MWECCQTPNWDGNDFPYTAKLCVNGHEYAKRQLEQAGIPYQALDNGFASCADPERLQLICEQLGPEQIDQLLRRWLGRLPHPFTRQDRAAGALSTLNSCRHLHEPKTRFPVGRLFPFRGGNLTR
jgi:hypothetical protein